LISRDWRAFSRLPYSGHTNRPALGRREAAPKPKMGCAGRAWSRVTLRSAGRQTRWARPGAGINHATRMTIRRRTKRAWRPALLNRRPRHDTLACLRQNKPARLNRRPQQDEPPTERDPLGGYQIPATSPYRHIATLARRGFALYDGPTLEGWRKNLRPPGRRPECRPLCHGREAAARGSSVASPGLPRARVNAGSVGTTWCRTREGHSANSDAVDRSFPCRTERGRPW